MIVDFLLKFMLIISFNWIIGPLSVCKFRYKGVREFKASQTKSIEGLHLAVSTPSGGGTLTTCLSFTVLKYGANVCFSLNTSENTLEWAKFIIIFLV